MISIPQFRADILRPTLHTLGSKYGGDAAENLILGTIVQESGFRYIRQMNGPALGLIQMEPDTLDDIYDSYLKHRPNLSRVMDMFQGDVPRIRAVQSHLDYACALCRIHYWRVPERLPDADDISGLARYYKKYYNTQKGRGTEAAFVLNYKTHIGE